MVNRVTKAERERIFEYAMGVVKLDRDMVVVNKRDAEDAIIGQFGISRARAATAVSRVARRRRFLLIKERRG